ncbi:hypothetical protein [Streptomyces sp. NPDC050535]|uniref:hypothetical protein n=1 Tax=Streptomyces sp. NPDC050535 TaxID=3365626 RepID=UPI0037A92F92
MDSGAIRRRAALGLAVLSTAGLLALVSPGAAEAAASYCAGREVRKLPFSTGTVRVYKSGGYICAVTFPKRQGARKQMSVSVQARGSRPAVDKGVFSHHAGPAKVHAGRRCVLVKGSVGRGAVNSGWILC